MAAQPLATVVLPRVSGRHRDRARDTTLRADPHHNGPARQALPKAIGDCP